MGERPDAAFAEEGLGAEIGAIGEVEDCFRGLELSGKGDIDGSGEVEGDLTEGCLLAGDGGGFGGEATRWTRFGG